MDSVFIKVKQVDTTSLLAKSSSSTKLMELESSSGAPPSGTSLQHLVQLDIDISLVLENLPDVWNNIWKRLEQLGLKDPTTFDSNDQINFNIFKYLKKYQGILKISVSICNWPKLLGFFSYKWLFMGIPKG